MPGMMDTVLNLGLNDKSVKGLAAGTDDERFAYDSYRRFISMYGRIVLDVPGDTFEHPLEAARERAGVATDAEIPAAALKELCAQYKAAVKEATGKPFPQDPMKQLRGAVEAVFRSWNGARAKAYRVRERISHDLGTAVNVQTMVFGNRDDNSGTGVGFTRNAATGENKPYGDFLINAQGEDVVAGIRNTEDLDAMKREFPVIHDELLAIFTAPRAALPGHVRHRVHDRAGQALDAPDPRRQAHRRRRPAHGRRDDEGHGQGRRQVEDLQGGGAHPGHGRAPRLGAAPAVRRHAATSSPRASRRRPAPPSARSTSRPTTPRRRARPARRSSS